jgi:hypothetical protein
VAVEAAPHREVLDWAALVEGAHLGLDPAAAGVQQAVPGLVLVYREWNTTAL